MHVFIPSKDLIFVADNIKVDQYRMTTIMSLVKQPFSNHRIPFGKPILVITGNMPEDLREEIDRLVKNYCNSQL